MRASKAASQFVETLDYPMAKAAIVAAARRRVSIRCCQDALKRVSDRECVNPADPQALDGI